MNHRNHGADLLLDSVLEEQRREVSYAKSLNSDIDFAFDLQLQEAISASLSANDDIAPHAPPPSQPPTDRASASRAPPPGDTSTASLARDEFDYMDLLLQDIERLDQERKDREASEALKLEMMGDLDRYIHDQKLAREILVIPEDEWARDGDNFNRPYGFPDLAQFGLVQEEEFRVYCKGVESEERVRDRTIIVGGIGVAVCDSEDNVIFEVSKRGLEVWGGGDMEKGKGVVGELGLEVGVEALVEGLEAALSWDLKRVAVFVDDFLVHQYVTGRAQPKQGRISTLVNEASLLQNQFTSCRPLLVPRNDIKFAFKLARDAVVSQITWPVETGKGKMSLKETCMICYEDIDVGQMFPIDGCLHRYCFSCMKQHVEVKLLNGMEAQCPHEGCKSQVAIHACKKFMDPKLVEVMIQRKQEASIPLTEKVYCPYPKCSALMSKTEVLEYTRPTFVAVDQSGARKCMNCCRFFCINCKVPWHYDMTCHDYKLRHPHPTTEDAMLNSLAKQKLWRQCVKCKQMVELAWGCYHITCRCGYEFCYTCGAEWKQKKATCKCPIWDERNIIRDGRRR